MGRIWNVRLNLDEFNAALAGLDGDRERLAFLSGLNAGFNGKPMAGKGPEWDSGWMVGNGARAEAQLFSEQQRSRALKRFPGSAPAQPRLPSGSAPDQPIHNPQSTIEESKNPQTTIQEEKAAPRPSRSKTPVRDNPPSLEDVQEYIQSKGYALDPQEFHDANTRGGWVYGKANSPVCDWRAHVRTWETRRKSWARPASSADEIELTSEHVPTAEQIAELLNP